MAASAQLAVVFASLNLLPNTPSLLRGDVLLRVIRPCTQSYVGLVIFFTGGLWSCLQVGNGDMLKEQRYSACSLANLPPSGASSVGEMLGLQAHVGSAPPTNCLGPGGSEDNG